MMVKSITYFFLVHVHEPVAHVKEAVDTLGHILPEVWWMCEVDPRNPLMLPHFTETELVVEKAQFLDNVVHD